MGKAVQFKVCGMTRLEDAQAAADAGASVLGFIFHSKSPRSIQLDRFEEIRQELPNLPKVAVVVNPDPSELSQYLSVGFSFVQVHFPTSTELSRIEEWSRAVGKDCLWIAPKIGPEDTFDPRWLDFAGTVLWDGYKKGAYGGTGHTSNWDLFSDLKKQFPATQWILAGGLGPDNLLDAIDQSASDFVDLNSALEISPGIKDQVKLLEVKSLLKRGEI